MSLNEWFRRINMSQYAPKLKKKLEISRVIDLKHLDDGKLKELGFKQLVARKRILEMLEGKDKMKEMFAFQTKS